MSVIFTNWSITVRGAPAAGTLDPDGLAFGFEGCQLFVSIATRSGKQAGDPLLGYVGGRRIVGIAGD